MDGGAGSQTGRHAGGWGEPGGGGGYRQELAGCLAACGQRPGGPASAHMPPGILRVRPGPGGSSAQAFSVAKRRTKAGHPWSALDAGCLAQRAGSGPGAGTQAAVRHRRASSKAEGRRNRRRADLRAAGAPGRGPSGGTAGEVGRAAGGLTMRGRAAKSAAPRPAMRDDGRLQHRVAVWRANVLPPDARSTPRVVPR